MTEQKHRIEVDENGRRVGSVFKVVKEGKVAEK